MTRLLRLPLLSPLIAALCLALPGLRADTAKADAGRTLAIVVVDTVRATANGNSDFDRLDIAFHQVAEARHWPLPITVERLAAGLPNYPVELRVYLQRPRQETPGDLTFRGWMTLTVDGKKHDFGVVTFRYYMRAGEQMDDVVDKVFRGAANEAAVRLEPILFPPAAAKP